MKHPDKLRRKLGYYKSLTLLFFKVYMFAKSCKSTTVFANFFLRWYKGQSFVFLQVELQAVLLFG